MNKDISKNRNNVKSINDNRLDRGRGWIDDVCLIFIFISIRLIVYYFNITYNYICSILIYLTIIP